MMVYPMHCPRCGSHVKVHYVDTVGAHWTCLKCGRNSDSYTVVYNHKTGKCDEVPSTNGMEMRGEQDA